MTTMMTPKDYVALPDAPPDTVFRYGELADQFGELCLPSTPDAPALLLLHGGCWRDAFGLQPTRQLARRLSQLGFAVCNLEYRRLGGGGGWPTTFEDVSAGLRAFLDLAPAHGFDGARFVVSGHSAGGHLSLWLGGRSRLAPGASLPGRGEPVPSAVVSLAGIGDLAAALSSDICRGAPGELMGGDSLTWPERYAQASPSALLPLSVPHWHVAGAADVLVPLTHVRNFVAAARDAGDRVKLTEVDGAGHFEIVTAGSAQWPQVEAVFVQVMENLRQ